MPNKEIPVLKHRFRGGRFKVFLRNPGKRILGRCDLYEKIIEIKPKQHRNVMLNTLIHEALHASFPRMKEKTVGRVSIDITSFVVLMSDAIGNSYSKKRKRGH